MTISKIAIFSSLKTFYEAGNDLIGVFGNLILQEISEDKTSIDIIKNKIELNYKFNIPTDVIRTILKRLKQNDYLTYNDINTQSVYILEKGESKKIEIQRNFKEADRENAALLKSIEQYIKDRDKGIKLSEEIIDNELTIFIENNTQDAINLIEKDGNGVTQQNKAIQSYIIEFFQISEKSDQTNFERLKAVLYGKIISSALLKRNFEKNAKFDNLNIYIDTNIFFSLIGLHEDCYNTPAQELIEIIKKLNISLKIFSFTKDEIISKLRGYLKDYDFYTPYIKVNSIYDVLKRKKYSKTDVIQIIEKIDDQIEKMGIEIDYSFDIEDLIKNYSEADKISKYNPDKGTYSVKHDVAAILAVRKLRNRHYSVILEKSKYIFLTADFALASYNFREFNHKDNGTVSEIILRNELAAILWLKYSNEYNNNSYAHSFLANHIKQQMISSDLWDKFINEIKTQKKRGLITDDDIDLLINYNETEKILSEKREEGIKLLINDKKIKELRAAQEEKDRKIQDGEKTLGLAKGEIINKNKELEEINSIAQDQADRLQLISTAIENSCRKKWNTIINCLLWVVWGIFVFILIILYIKTNIYSVIKPYFFILLFIILTFIILELRFKRQIMPKKIKDYIPDSLNFPKIRNDFERNKIERSILKKKKKLGLR